MDSLTPRQIVAELDRFVIGQYAAKKSVSIALRNRWRRQQVDSSLKDEILPKNILMIGATGVGKTEIARRLAKLVQAPFVKVEATKFTEIGYVGRDVEQIIRDLAEISVANTKEKHKILNLEKAQKNVEAKIISILVGENASEETKLKFSKMFADKILENNEIEIKVHDNNSAGSMFDLPGNMGSMGMFNLSEMMSKTMGFAKTKTKKVKVSQARELLLSEEADNLIDNEKMTKESIDNIEQNGIVFIDEIDKICNKNSKQADVSREGVQRDLLPLIEGCTVNTKYGPIKTDHILFIASGAFHISKPSDLLPELQGRLPIRVELSKLTKSDFVKILQDTETSLLKQYIALLKTENVTIEFTKEAIETIAEIATNVNDQVENIGARRLHTIMEKLVEDLSFAADDYVGKNIKIDTEYVEKHVGELAKSVDLSQFIL